MFDYDVISIGAGSGGCASVMRSADLGKKAALVEYRDKDGTGGTCVNRGCIPAKVLVKSAEVFNEVKSARQYGILADNIHADLKLVNQKKQTAVKNLKFGLDNLLLKPRKIDRLKGKARLLDSHTVEITRDGEVKTVTAQNIILATGSEPAMIPSFHIDGQNILTSNEALDLSDIPKSILIVGAGALGLEFAYIYSSFGSKVTLAEMMPHVVPTLQDTEITNSVEKYLTKMNIVVKTNVKITSIDVGNNGKVISTFESGEKEETDKVLVAIGRSLNTKDLGLDAIGVKTTPKGQVVVDKNMRTSVENIFAVGDIVEGAQLSHKAQRQGVVAAEVIAGMGTEMDYNVLPWAIFMHPEIAGVGMTEEEAEAKGIEVLVGRMPFNANEKAMTMQKTTGMIKIIARKDNGQIIGGAIFGVDASVLIEEIALAVQKNITVEDIASSIHTHPTLSEIVMETAKNALGKSFHR